MFAKSMFRDGRVMFAALCGAAGIAYLGIGLARDEKGFAFSGLAVMVAYAVALLAFRKRAEPLALLSGNPEDERQAQVMLRALAATAQVVMLALVAGLMVSLAAGSRYAAVFCALAALGGLTVVVATVWYSRRL